jgi:biopolymer transport protein ExbB
MKYLLSILLLSLTVGTADLFAQQPPTADTSAVPGEAATDDAADSGTETPSAEADAGTGTTTDAEAAESTEADADPGDEDADSMDDGSSVTSVLDEILSTGAIGLLRDGGIFMWPILIMGIIAAGVIIERYRSLKLMTGDTSALRSEVLDLLQQDRVEEAHRLCDQQQGPVPAILGAGLRKFLVLRRLNYDPAKIEEQVVKAMDDYSVHIVAALERHLPVLATVSSVAPMLGFLGTVQGMIVAFEDIVAKMGEMNIVEAAASGISVALLTTCFGLIIGIPAFISFNYFSSVINRFVLDVEESATDLIETVTLHMALEQAEETPTTA